MVMTATRTSLLDLVNDVLIHVLIYLGIGDILAVRQASKRLYSLSKLQSVWQAICTRHVIDEGFPFPTAPLNQVASSDLEKRTRHAFRLGQFWLSSSATPRKVSAFSASSGTSVSEVRFLPSRPDWLITVSKGIWPVITCWDLSLSSARPTAKVAEWSPRGAVFTGIAVNSVQDAEGLLAVSAIFPNKRQIYILAVRSSSPDAQYTFDCLATLDSAFKAMSLRGDLVAISDDVNETHIINWRTGSLAVLWGSNEPSEHNFQHNRCLDVVFARQCMFVVRARSFEAFAPPTLLPVKSISEPYYPIARHHFGWIDGVAVSESCPIAEEPANEPLSIVLRAESDDPWSSDMHTLDLYHLQRAESHADTTDTTEAAVTRQPYAFPPLHRASWPSARGHLRCTDITLGPKGTAIWIQPRPSRNTDLTGFDVHSSDAQGAGHHPLTGTRIAKKECLVAAVFPGAMRSRHKNLDEGARTLWTLDDISRNWTSFDYDEARGVVALGDSHGEVLILDLAPS